MIQRRADTGVRPRDTESLDVYGLPQPPDWTLDAACAEIGPDLFFQKKGGSNREAKSICRTCPVQTECLEYALAHDDTTSASHVHGIYGGMPPRARYKLRQQRETEGTDAA